MGVALRHMRIIVGRVRPFECCMKSVSKVCEQLPPLLILPQMFSLNFKQAGFHGRGAAQAPQHTSQSQHEFTLDGGLSVIIGDDSCFELPVVFGIFPQSDDSFSR
jgi:hypothetical protein